MTGGGWGARGRVGGSRGYLCVAGFVFVCPVQMADVMVVGDIFIMAGSIGSIVIAIGVI